MNAVYSLIDSNSGKTIATGSRERMVALAEPGDVVLRRLDDGEVAVVFRCEPEPVWAGHCLVA